MSTQPQAPVAGPDGGPPPIHDCRILVVDDTDFNRTLIGALLREAGFHNVGYANDGFQALEQIAAHPPDIVLLDIMMPVMDGFEVCRKLRADHAYADLPVLVQTALSSSDDRNRAFAAGTTDLISKPLDRTELLARVRIHLENRALIRDLQLYRARVEGELAMARSMYDHLLPSEKVCRELEEGCGVRLRSHTVVSSEMGGNIWGVLRLDAGRFGVFLLDTPGRGVATALNAFRLHTLVNELEPLAAEPDAFLAELNDRAVRLLELGEHVSVLYGVVDAAAGRFDYAAAAAPPPVLLAPPYAGPLPEDGGGSDGGEPVGAGLGARYERLSLPFAPGAGVALCNGNVREALTRDGRADDLLRRALAAQAEGADAFALMTAALSEAIGPNPGDDHTLVWLARPAA